MKKYTYFITLCCFLTVVFSSCSDELEIKPTSELESEFFDSEQRVQQGIGACYATITHQYMYFGGIHRILLLPGDDVTLRDNSQRSYEAFSGLNPTNDQVSKLWTRHYQLVFRTNFMLEKIEEPEIKALYTRDGFYNANKGEALFLRSWVFYRLWDWFRKAPIQDKRIVAIDDALLPPSEGFEMLDKAIADLEEAAQLLPPVTFWDDATEKGRLFNESAYGLLVKCYVLRARYNGKNADDYKKAITAFEKITTRRLVNFEDNFDYHFENNDESLFEFQASNNAIADNPWLDNDFGDMVGTMGVGYHYCTDYWVNYETGTFGPTKKLMAAYEADDPRKEGTFSKDRTNLYGDLNVPAGWGWGYFDGYQLQKYVKPGKCVFDGMSAVNSANNVRLIRYADVKLLVAEAYLQTGDQAKALQQVNDIRKRARESTKDGSVSAVPADLSAVTINDIMDERFRELAVEEGIRWTDLRSWHVAGFIDLNTWSATDFGFNYDAADFEFSAPKHLLFPIPQKEMDTNPLMSASGNNPGY